MWNVWDKKTDINGFSAEDFLARNKHLQNEETIYIKTVDGRVTQVEGKNILASVYGIDPTLSDDAFIEEYERKLATEEVYDEAIDVEGAPFTYEETDIPIERDEIIENNLEG